jgi:hypothetical protein
MDRVSRRRSKTGRVAVRYSYFIDADQHSAWTEYLDIPPAEGQVIEHDGRTYVVNANPVHTWFDDSEEMVMLTLTTVDDDQESGS